MEHQVASDQAGVVRETVGKARRARLQQEMRGSERPGREYEGACADLAFLARGVDRARRAHAAVLVDHQLDHARVDAQVESAGGLGGRDVDRQGRGLRLGRAAEGRALPTVQAHTAPVMRPRD